MRVVVVSGVCVPHDAISAIAAWQAESIARQPNVDEVTLVTQEHTRQVGVPVVTVGSSWDLVRSACVRSADVVIYHWGIYNDLFNSLILLRDEQQAIVHFHNLTPPELVDPSARKLQEASVRQLYLAAMTNPTWWADSAYNGETLRSMGLTAGDVPIVSCPVEPPRGLFRKSEFASCVQLLTVGRLVPAKGVDVLIEAMGAVLGEREVDLRLTLVANSAFSGSQYADALSKRVAELGLEARIRVLSNATDEQLWAEYSAADVLVSPSLHEGLCVPVIEAYSAGCRVIGTDAGNLPYIVQAPDPIVPAGDPKALGKAISAMCREIAGQRVAPRPEIETMLSQYTTAACEAALASELRIARRGVA